jgi:DNA-binding NarL/FixJ family response regulator
LSIQILLADDHEIMRSGLRTLIQNQTDMQVVAEASNGRTTVLLAEEKQPDVIVMDISMPDLNGIDAARQIHQNHPDIKIIALSMHSDRQFISAMLKAGASGYLLKDSAFEELERAIHAVTKDQVYLSSKITSVVVEDYKDKLSDETSSVFQVLSSREREVLQLLAEGQSVKQIAAQLFLSVKTIETHRQHIMEKLGIKNIPDLVKYAIREGLTDLE